MEVIDLLRKLSETNNRNEKKLCISQLIQNFSCQEINPIEIAIENKLYHVALLLLKYGSPLPRKSPFNFYKNADLIQSRIKVWREEETMICPITREIIIEPAVIEDGSTYEKDAIIEWFHGHDVNMSRFDMYATAISRELARDNYETAQQLACSQLLSMYKYISPVTNIKLDGDPIIYLPKTDDFMII